MDTVDPSTEEMDSNSRSEKKVTKDIILEAIEALKSRKARPDKNRICHHLERKYGFNRDDIFHELARAVASGAVLKVKYKDFYSYRNPSKTLATSNSKIKAPKKASSLSKTNPTIKGQRSFNANRRLEQAIKCLNRIGQISRAEKGSDLKAAETSDSKISTQTDEKMRRDSSQALAGNVRIFSDGDNNSTFSTETSLLARELFEITDENGLSDNSLDNQDSSSSRNGFRSVQRRKNKVSPHDESNFDRKPEEQQTVQRGRPVSQRKKIKKSLGPDFLDPSDLRYQYLKDTYGPKCQYCDCQFTSNRQDRYLSCGKCSAKAHLRCLATGAENLEIDDWLCEKCVTICSLCGLTNENEEVYICNECENIFHLICLKIFEKNSLLTPRDVWTCRPCRAKHDRESVNPKIMPNERVANVTSKNHRTFVEDLQDEVPAAKPSKSSQKEAKVLLYHKLVLEDLIDTFKRFAIDPDPRNWTIADVETYISKIGFPDQAPLFKEQLIDGKSLLLLRRMDVLSGLSMKLGPALKIYAHINQLQASDFESASTPPVDSQSSEK